MLSIRVQSVLLFFVLLASSYTYSQEKSISDWQKSHPEVEFIEASVFTSLTPDAIDRLNGRYILYYGEISWEDIKVYESALTTQNQVVNRHVPVGANVEDAQFVKDWLALHPSVILLTRSEQLRLTIQEDPAKYHNSHYILLMGEQITKEDIVAYQVKYGLN